MRPSPLLQPADHPSYHLHRRQVWTQVLLPILLMVLILIGLVVLISIATFRDNGDVSRWAAISTIWLVLPVMVVGLIFLILLIALVYLLAKLIGVIPPYSYLAQRFVYQVEGRVEHVAGLIRKPVLALQELGALVMTYIKRARERM